MSALQRVFNTWEGNRAGRIKAVALAGGALLVTTLVAYGPALRGSFIWDDAAHVTQPALRSLKGLARIWFEPGTTQQYYPLAHTGFWVQWWLWGRNPMGYHVMNVVLHVGSALLVWRILKGLGVPGALVAGWVWALHPVQVESVAWITEMKNTLSTVLYLGALWAYLRWDPLGAPPAQRRDWQWYALALLLFVSALLSKTVTASLPAAVLLVAWWKEGRVDWGRRVAPLLPFFVLGVAMGLATAWVERHYVGAEGELFTFSWLERVLIAGRAVWFYVGKLVWPVGLMFIYPRWAIDVRAWWQWGYPVAAVAAVGVLWGLRGRWGRGPLVAALYFGGTLVPALGFVNVYPFRFSFVADHFQYLASLGVLGLGAAGVALGLGKLGKWGRPVRWAVGGGLVVVLAGLSWQQAHIYSDAETLYRDIIARNPPAFMAYNNLGLIYYKQGRYAEAIELFKAVLSFKPDYANAYYNLGAVYAQQRRYAEAIAAFKSAIAIKPNDAEAYYNMSLMYRGEGKEPEAIAAWETAARIARDRRAMHSQRPQLRPRPPP